MATFAEEIDAEMKYYEQEPSRVTLHWGDDCEPTTKSDIEIAEPVTSRRGGSFDLSTDDSGSCCFGGYAFVENSHMSIEMSDSKMSSSSILTFRVNGSKPERASQIPMLLELFSPRPPKPESLESPGIKPFGDDMSNLVIPQQPNSAGSKPRQTKPKTAPSTPCKRNRRTNNPKVLKSVGSEGLNFHNKLKKLFVHHTASKEDTCPLYREVLLVCFDRVICLDGHSVLLAKYKRFDQFEKRAVSALKSRVFSLFQNQRQNRAETRQEICSHFGIASNQLFDGLFGEQTKNGLRNHVVDGLLKNQKLFQFVFSTGFAQSLVNFLNSETDCDIVTSIVSPASSYFAQTGQGCSISQDSTEFEKFRNHLHKGQNFKRPFTYMENILSMLYFLDKFNKRAGKLPECSLRLERLASLKELGDMLESKLVQEGLCPAGAGIEPNNSKARDRLNFVRLISYQEYPRVQ